ncbi:hypothetical protein E4U51_000795, partial [Claviceps purpurea]
MSTVDAGGLIVELSAAPGSLTVRQKLSVDDQSPANQIFQAPPPCDHAIHSRDDH